MRKLAVEIENFEEQIIYGLWMKSNDRTISKDIHILSTQYQAIFALKKGNMLPFFVLSKNYNERTKDFDLLIGGKIERDGLKAVMLPAGEYARITVKPKFGFLWGIVIGDAKRYFYRKWLPASAYQSLNMEYELHTEQSMGEHPTIDLIFAIQKKNK